MTKREYAEGIFMSRRLKLSRNLRDKSFTAAMTTEDSLQIKAEISEQFRFMEWLQTYKLKEISLENRLIQQMYYQEGVLVTDPLRSNLEIALYASEQGDLKIAINDLDHLRLMLSSSNESFDELWQKLDLLDDGIGQRLNLAYMEPFGFLTSRIEQLGTGLNGECILHLPALHKTGFIKSLTESMGSIGIQIKPYKGDFYIIYNTVTLGRQEIEIALLLDQVVEKISEREWAGRETLWASEGYKIKDQIGRCFGASQYAGQVDEAEGVEWLSYLILGDRYGVIQPMEGVSQGSDKWQRILHRISDIEIDAEAGRILNHRERCAKRSEILGQVSRQWKWRG